MIVFTVLILSMGVLSAIFWWIEAQPFVSAVKELRTDTFGEKFTYFFRFLGQLPKAMPLLIDLGATIGLAYLFGLGGVVGTALGLTISNVLSIAILWTVYSGKGKKAEVCHA